MANDLNTVFLIGRLTRDPEYKLVGSTPLVNFSLANNRIYMQNGEKKEEVSYFDCTAWGKLADVIRQYVNKGKQVAIEGRLKQESWDTPDGKKASKVRIVVNNIQLLGSSQASILVGSSEEVATKTYSAPVYEPVPSEIDPEDIF